MTTYAEKLYTETLPQQDRGTVLRIAARRGNAFRTHTLQPPEMTDGPWHRRWREARLDRDSGLWDVEEIRTVPSQTGADYAEKVVPVLKGACFFDALHSCALFETQGEALGETRTADGETAGRGLSHYRAFGEREGIPFDETTGLPVPAADGRRLGGGTFAPQARDVVAQSEGNLTAKAPERRALLDDVVRPAGALVPVGLGESGKNLNALIVSKSGEATTLEKTRKRLRGTELAINDLRKKFSREIESGFSDNQGEDSGSLTTAAVVGTASLGVGAAGGTLGAIELTSATGALIPGLFFGGVGTILGGFGVLCLVVCGFAAMEKFTPQGVTRLSMWDFEGRIKKLPDSPLKEEMTRLSHEIRQGFFGLWFRHCCREAFETGRWLPRRRMNRARRHFIAACRKQGLDDAVTENRLDILAQDIGSKTLDEELARRIDRAMQDAAKHLENLKDAEPDVLKALPAPAVPEYPRSMVETVRDAEAENVVKNPQPGQLVPGKGVFLGTWPPEDRHGRSLNYSLNRIFNIFAAPYDLGLDETGNGLKLIATYDDAVKAVGKIQNLMGHKGAKYRNETELYEALQNGNYEGEWFIPPQSLVNGTDPANSKIQADNLYRHRDTDRFAGTFTTASSSGDARWYWSCSELPNVSSCAWAIDFTDGRASWTQKKNDSLSLRLVRAEPRP